MVVIANPASGWGKGRRRTPAAAQVLRDRGIRPQVWWTEGRGHAHHLAQRARDQGARTVVACGGDGTLHEVVQALAGSDVRLAPVPAGRCNDFCRALGWRPDARHSLDALHNGAGRRVDLGRVNGSYFCTVGAVGFDAVVSRFVDGMRLPLRGTAAYLYAILRILPSFQPPQVKVTWEGGSYEGPILLLAVGNTRTYGNNIPIVPSAVLDDGLLDLCLVRAAGFWRVASLLPALLRGRHGMAHEVSFHRSPWVKVESETSVEMWADGEPVTTTPLDIAAAPGALLAAASHPAP